MKKPISRFIIVSTSYISWIIYAVTCTWEMFVLLEKSTALSYFINFYISQS